MSFNGSPAFGRRRRLLCATCLGCALAASVAPSWSDEPPNHYFRGYVCRSKKLEVHSAGYPCERPIEGVVVTARNSSGQMTSTKTDSHGYYSLDPIPLHGRDGDLVTYEAPKYLTVRVGPLTFNPHTTLSIDSGAVILLPKQHRERVVIR